jgi:iron-sulfur cluster repair protein YtfE (RIC family)
MAYSSQFKTKKDFRKKGTENGERSIRVHRFEHSRMDALMDRIHALSISDDWLPLIGQLRSELREHIQSEESVLFEKARAHFSKADF